VPLDHEVFLDTAYVIALANSADEHHERAATLAASMISFLVMEQRRLRQALTTDEHFEQAGFVALLRN